MKNLKKKTSVKVTPLEGHFFDIKPPAGGVRPPKSNKWRGFWLFFWMAVMVFIGMNLYNIYSKGMDVAVESKGFALEGYDKLNSGIESLKKSDLDSAEQWFKSAENSFRALSDNAGFLVQGGNQLIDQNLYLDAADKLVNSALSASIMGQDAIKLIRNVSQLPKEFAKQKSPGETEAPLMPAVREYKTEFDSILKKVLEIQNNLTTMNTDILPADFKNKITEGQRLIAKLLVPLNEADSNFGVVLTLLGDKVPHRYLVLLQNNHELRATGGFLGSYMVIDVNDGAITKMESKDVYETDGQLLDVVTPPAGIDQVSERWYMRDANYSPDFAVSAEKVMWFLEHSRGPSVDTVIAIDQDVIEKMLEITGPVKLEHFPFQIKSDNFNQIISFYTEAKLSDTSTPKQLLFDFIPVFKEKFFDLDKMLDMKDILEGLIWQRHIQAYSKDPAVQSLINMFHADGAISQPEPDVDFLAPVTTSIGGNKSDQYIETEIGHETEIANTGLVIDNLSVTKHHTWNESDFNEWKRLIGLFGAGKTGEDTLRFIHGEGDNVDYMRIYVPKGSKLLEAGGMNKKDITVSEDLGYTVFAFVFRVSSGTEKTVRLKYQLPFESQLNSYNLIARKQAGFDNTKLVKTLSVPEGYEVTESIPPSAKIFSRSPFIETDLDSDKEFSFKIGRD